MNREFKNLSRRNYQLVEEEIAAAKRSLYYWWWRYLRISADYWWLCRQGGKTQDKDFARTYRDFGDIFDEDDDFDRWWKLNGAKLFAYPLTPPKVNYYNDDEILLRRRKDWYETIIVPKFFTKSEIILQLERLLKEHKPEPLPKDLRATRSIADLRGIRKAVLIDSHKVWCLSHSIHNAKIENKLKNPSIHTQFWIGKALNLIPPVKIGRDFTIRERELISLTMRVKVNRHLSNAKRIVGNVEIGIFPSIKPPSERKYWTKTQFREMNEAIDAGEWISPESTAEEFHNLLLPSLKKI